MEQRRIDPQQFPEPFRRLLEGLDLKALESLANSLDRDQVAGMAAGMLEMLKQSMSPQEYQALAQLLAPLMMMMKKEE